MVLTRTFDVEVYGNNVPAVVGALKVHIEGGCSRAISGIPGYHSFFKSNEKLESIWDVSAQIGCFIPFDDAHATTTLSFLRLHADHKIAFEDNGGVSL